MEYFERIKVRKNHPSSKEAEGGVFRIESGLEPLVVQGGGEWNISLGTYCVGRSQNAQEDDNFVVLLGFTLARRLVGVGQREGTD